MDPLQRTLAQALAVWRGLGRPQQIGLVVVLAAALGLGLTLATLGRGPDMAVAFSGLSDEDAAAVVAKLKEARIPYELGDGGTVRVPGALVNDVKVMMAGQGLGGKPVAGVGFELFNQPVFGQTEFAQRVNYQRALEGELARSIGRMDAVASARVHLVIPQPTLFSSQQKDPTASVILQLKPGKRLDSAQVRSISALVAGSVEGLKPQNLAIVDVNGNVLSGDESGAGPAGLTNKQMDAQRSYEASLERNLQALLDSTLGAGNAVVRVSALLDWNQVEETSETFAPVDPNAPAPLKSSSESTEKQAPGLGGAPAGGVPGPAANEGAVPTYQGAQANGQGGYEKTQKDATYETSKTVQKIVRSPGAVKRLSVSVLVNQPEPRATASEEEKAQVRARNEAWVKAVSAAIPSAAGIDTQGRGDQITVTPLAFNREQLEETRVAMAEADQRDQVLSYARLAALALGPLVLLVALGVILRRPSRAAQTGLPALGAPAGRATGSERAPEKPGSPPAPKVPPRPIAEDPQKAYIRDQIAGLAKGNPATVAQLIQTWMDEDRRN